MAVSGRKWSRPHLQPWFPRISVDFPGFHFPVISPRSTDGPAPLTKNDVLPPCTPPPARPPRAPHCPHVLSCARRRPHTAPRPPPRTHASLRRSPRTGIPTPNFQLPPAAVAPKFSRPGGAARPATSPIIAHNTAAPGASGGPRPPPRAPPEHDNFQEFRQDADGQDHRPPPQRNRSFFLCPLPPARPPRPLHMLTRAQLRTPLSSCRPPRPAAHARFAVPLPPD